MGVATYNWTFKGGIYNFGVQVGDNTFNQFTLTIPVVADDVRPTGSITFIYVSNFGDDYKGNGSRRYPFKTINRALAVDVVAANASACIIFSSGEYFENYIGRISVATYYIGDGNVILNGTGLNSLLQHAGGASTVYCSNITFKNTFDIAVTGNSVFFSNCKLSNLGGITSSTGGMMGCIVENVTGQVSIREGAVINRIIANTFVNCVNITMNGSVNPGNRYVTQNNIFKKCNIWSSVTTQMDYCIFYQCNFKFSAVQGTVPTSTSGVPIGYTAGNTLSDIQNAQLAAGFTTGINFENSRVVDPLFNNEAIGDYSLQFTSPAKNMSFYGTYIGARSIAESLKVRQNTIASAFDNLSAINLNIEDDNITLIDRNQKGVILTKPISNILGRELLKLPVIGFNASRNGEFVDSTSDLALTTLGAGDALSTTTPYIVEVAAITYNGQVYQPGNRFTSTAAGGTFTTTMSGVVREIIEAPARENVEARFSGGAASTIDNSGALTADSWYYVENNPVTYNGNVYAAGTFFKCVPGVTSFTGSGVVREVFAASDTWFYFELNQKPTSNNVGNTRTGDIVRGNGDKDFDRTAANVFPISKKFIQLRYTIQVNNLKP